MNELDHTLAEEQVQDLMEWHVPTATVAEVSKNTKNNTSGSLADGGGNFS